MHRPVLLILLCFTTFSATSSLSGAEADQALKDFLKSIGRMKIEDQAQRQTWATTIQPAWLRLPRTGIAPSAQTQQHRRIHRQGLGPSTAARLAGPLLKQLQPLRQKALASISRGPGTRLRWIQPSKPCGRSGVTPWPDRKASSRNCNHSRLACGTGRIPVSSHARQAPDRVADRSGDTAYGLAKTVQLALTPMADRSWPPMPQPVSG